MHAGMVSRLWHERVGLTFYNNAINAPCPCSSQPWRSLTVNGCFQCATWQPLPRERLRHRPRTVVIQPELGETSTITASVPAEVVLMAGAMKWRRWNMTKARSRLAPMTSFRRTASFRHGVGRPSSPPNLYILEVFALFYTQFLEPPLVHLVLVLVGPSYRLELGLILIIRSPVWF